MTTVAKLALSALILSGCAAHAPSHVVQFPVVVKDAPHHCFGDHIPSTAMWCQDDRQECQYLDGEHLQCTERIK